MIPINYSFTNLTHTYIHMCVYVCGCVWVCACVCKQDFTLNNLQNTTNYPTVWCFVCLGLRGKFNEKNVSYEVRFGLVGFHSISTIVGYLKPNLGYTFIINI